eukprot:813851-Prorocentrum_lima.AAC.1
MEDSRRIRSAIPGAMFAEVTTSILVNSLWGNSGMRATTIARWVEPGGCTSPTRSTLTSVSLQGP